MDAGAFSYRCEDLLDSLYPFGDMNNSGRTEFLCIQRESYPRLLSDQVDQHIEP